MSHESAMSQLFTAASMLKFTRLVEEKFNNDQSEVQKAIGETAEKVKEKSEEIVNLLSAGVVHQLSAFRKAVGEDMWATIAANPAINDLLQEWLSEQKIKAASILVEEFRAILPENHGMTDKEILHAVMTIVDCNASG